MSDLGTALELRHSIRDLANLKGIAGTRVAEAEARLTIRDGILLHYSYSQPATFDGPMTRDSIAEKAENSLGATREWLNELGLEVASWAVRIDLSNDWDLLNEFDVVADHAGLRAQGRTSTALAYLSYSLGQCYMTYLHIDDTQPDSTDTYYYHWLTCEALRSIMRARSTAIATRQVQVLHAPQSPRQNEPSKQHFASALGLQGRVTEDRRLVNELEFRQQIVADFRYFHSVDTPSLAAIENSKAPSIGSTLEQEYEASFFGPLRVYLTVMRESLERSTQEARNYVDLSNMIYNTRIQEVLHRLQWIAVIVSLLSLVATAMQLGSGEG